MAAAVRRAEGGGTAGAGRALALKKPVAVERTPPLTAAGTAGQLRRLHAPDGHERGGGGASRLTGAGAGSVARPGAPVYVQCAP